MSNLIVPKRLAARKASGAARALAEVRKAVLRGDLPPVTNHIYADCGKPAQAYDHRDYSKPLEVDPVCDSCNGRRGAALPSSVANELYGGAAIELEAEWKEGKHPPVLLPDDVVAQCKTYREAVRVAWDRRAVPAATRARLAECIGALPQHVTDYFHPDDAPSRRSLQPEMINDFEWFVGNRAVTQYLLRKADLMIAEEKSVAERVE
ncbi:hypothetical protein [Paraburkholderia caledonica]|uniref:Uncharacterized protein n=1 Tax=Paraburkholderia caledonica TaxID=134536 RepID=A0AB73IV71_9BURK|nr:hypothetical protein [Paraburkholderia caledonica]